MSSTLSVKALLSESARLHAAIDHHCGQLGFPPGPRLLLSATASVISLEHARGINTLVREGSATYKLT